MMAMPAGAPGLEEGLHYSFKPDFYTEEADAH